MYVCMYVCVGGYLFASISLSLSPPVYLFLSINMWVFLLRSASTGISILSTVKHRSSSMMRVLQTCQFVDVV